MQHMRNLLKNLINTCGILGVFCVTCARAGAPYEIHKVSLAPISLPSKFVADSSGVSEIEPSIWNRKTLRFSAGMPQKIIVRKNDNLSTISERYAVPIRNIIELNHLKAPYALQAGQSLTLLGSRIHIVHKNEDLYEIAELHNVSLSSITRQNKIKPPYKLKEGQKLILPASPIDSAVGEEITSAPGNLPKKNYGSISKQELRKKLRVLPKRTGVRFKKPVRGPIISGYGPKGSGLYNDGINIKAKEGALVVSGDHGVIVYCGNDIKSYGNLILVKHKGGWITAYGHLSKISVKKGQTVRPGEAIGSVGSTGFVSIPQLHFEVRRNGKPLNPSLYL